MRLKRTGPSLVSMSTWSRSGATPSTPAAPAYGATTTDVPLLSTPPPSRLTDPRNRAEALRQDRPGWLAAEAAEIEKPQEVVSQIGHPCAVALALIGQHVFILKAFNEVQLP